NGNSAESAAMRCGSPLALQLADWRQTAVHSLYTALKLTAGLDGPSVCDAVELAALNTNKHSAASGAAPGRPAVICPFARLIRLANTVPKPHLHCVPTAEELRLVL